MSIWEFCVMLFQLKHASADFYGVCEFLCAVIMESF